jgi:hypothetical protein
MMVLLVIKYNVWKAGPLKSTASKNVNPNYDNRENVRTIFMWTK